MSNRYIIPSTSRVPIHIKPKPTSTVLREQKTRSMEQTRAYRNNPTIIQKLDIRKGSIKITGKRINSEIRKFGSYLTQYIKIISRWILNT